MSCGKGSSDAVLLILPGINAAFLFSVSTAVYKASCLVGFPSPLLYIFTFLSLLCQAVGIVPVMATLKN